MGSKNLKAIAVRGKRQIPVADRQLMSEISKEFSAIVMENPLTRGLRKRHGCSCFWKQRCRDFADQNFHYGEVTVLNQSQLKL